MKTGTSLLKPLEASAIREVANIGLGHATTALAEVAGKSLGMSVPHADAVALEELPYLLGDDTIQVGVWMPLAGEIEGHVAFVMPWPAAQGLWTALVGNAPEHPEEIDELYASVMTEIGNILDGSFLSSISDLTGLRLEATPPQLAVDLGIAVIGAIVCEFGETDLPALAIHTTIQATGDELGGTFLFMPTQAGLGKVFAALGLEDAA